MTAHDYMLATYSDIDELLGKGTAGKHPELVAAYMHAAKFDFAGNILAQQLRAGLDGIAETLQSGFSCDEHRTDHPPMGQTSTISAAL